MKIVTFHNLEFAVAKKISNETSGIKRTFALFLIVCIPVVGAWFASFFDQPLFQSRSGIGKFFLFLGPFSFLASFFSKTDTMTSVEEESDTLQIDSSTEVDEAIPEATSEATLTHPMLRLDQNLSPANFGEAIRGLLKGLDKSLITRELIEHLLARHLLVEARRVRDSLNDSNPKARSLHKVELTALLAAYKITDLIADISPELQRLWCLENETVSQLNPTPEATKALQHQQYNYRNNGSKTLLHGYTKNSKLQRLQTMYTARMDELAEQGQALSDEEKQAWNNDFQQFYSFPSVLMLGNLSIGDDSRPEVGRYIWKDPNPAKVPLFQHYSRAPRFEVPKPPYGDTAGFYAGASKPKPHVGVPNFYLSEHPKRLEFPKPLYESIAVGASKPARHVPGPVLTGRPELILWPLAEGRSWPRAEGRGSLAGNRRWPFVKNGGSLAENRRTHSPSLASSMSSLDLSVDNEEAVELAASAPVRLNQRRAKPQTTERKNDFNNTLDSIFAFANKHYQRNTERLARPKYAYYYLDDDDKQSIPRLLTALADARHRYSQPTFKDAQRLMNKLLGIAQNEQRSDEARMYAKYLIKKLCASPTFRNHQITLYLEKLLSHLLDPRASLTEFNAPELLLKNEEVLLFLNKDHSKDSTHEHVAIPTVTTVTIGEASAAFLFNYLMRKVQVKLDRLLETQDDSCYEALELELDCITSLMEKGVLSFDNKMGLLSFLVLALNRLKDSNLENNLSSAIIAAALHKHCYMMSANHDASETLLNEGVSLLKTIFNTQSPLSENASALYILYAMPLERHVDIAPFNTNDRVASSASTNADNRLHDLADTPREENIIASSDSQIADNEYLMFLSEKTAFKAMRTAVSNVCSDKEAQSPILSTQ